MPGCDFTRRDFLRWTAVAAASPSFARRLLENGVAAAASRKDAVSPVNLELVTLTEDRAIITWYTGYTGTDDGLGRMEPAPADGVVHWGTNPQRLNRVAGGRSRDTPYHYVELTGLEPGETYYYQARSNDMPVPPTPFTLISGNAVGTSDFGLTTGGPYSFTAFPRRRRADSSSPSRCATTCTWGRRRPGSSEAPRSPGYSKLPACRPTRR